MMIEGIKAALDFPHDPRRFRLVSFMTDGYIGNEKEILGEIHQRLGSTRIFSLGIGSSVNRYLLDRMAKLLDVDVFVLGHQPQTQGWCKAGENLIILACDHNHGCLLPIDLSRTYTAAALADRIVPLAAIE